MRMPSYASLHRVAPLAAAIVAMLSTPSFAGLANSVSNGARQPDFLPARTQVARRGETPSLPSTVLTVKNCQDDGADSLRALVSAAGEGDTIEFDLAQMQCSVITLSSVEIPIIRNNLSFRGPAGGAAKITISGDHQHRVFDHVGTGILSVSNLDIRDGNADGSGGCIRSSGSVTLERTDVVGCVAIDPVQPTGGGGVAAQDDLILIFSSVSGNRAGDESRPGFGGGVHTNGNAVFKYTSISDNYASAKAGGALVQGSTYSLGTTVDHNRSQFAAALWLTGDAELVNSTISSNTAKDGGVAIFSTFGSLAIESSTVTLNSDSSPQPVGAVTFQGATAGSQLVFQNSIIANNTTGSNAIEDDILSLPGIGVVAGAANLVGASNTWPPGVFIATDDPGLGPLQANGGVTRTHRLLSDSPARSIGNNNAGQSFDQRGSGYPRITGLGQSATADIGSIQFDSIFFGGFEYSN